MTAREWMLSILIAAHLVAISVAAVPRPSSSPLPRIPRQDADPVAAVLEPPMTALGERLNAAQRWTMRVTRGVRSATRPYIAAGLSQNWSMFSSVLTVQRYVRLDYFVDETPGKRVVFQELVLPSQPEGQPRLSYRSADKAVRVVMGSYLSRLRDEESDLDDLSDGTGDGSKLAPLVRYFVARFCESVSIPREAISRVEVWTGAVPIAPPGQPATFPTTLRWDALARYRSPAPQPASFVPSPLWSTRVQADITWQLVFAEAQP
jgi:hypothetical protein